MNPEMLQPDEKVLCEVRLQGLFVFESFGVFLASVLTLGLYAYLFHRANYWVITDRRLIHRRGILSRDTVEMELGRVAQVETSSGVLDRLMGIGRIRIIALDQFKFEMYPIAAPDRIKSLLMGAVADARRGQSAASAAVPAGSAGSPGSPGSKDEVLSALERLGRLKATGVVTDLEFEQKKRELLARI